jgi:hypothetical protein
MVFLLLLLLLFFTTTSQSHFQNPMPQSGETMISIKQEIHLPSSIIKNPMPQSNPPISSDAPTSQSSSSFSTTTITLSNKQCSQTRDSSTKLIPSSIIKNPMPQPGQATMALNQTRHSSTKIIPSSIIKNPMPQSGQATIALNQTRENLPSSFQAPTSKTQYHKSNTTISSDA